MNLIFFNYSAVTRGVDFGGQSSRAKEWVAWTSVGDKAGMWNGLRRYSPYADGMGVVREKENKTSRVSPQLCAVNPGRTDL